MKNLLIIMTLLIASFSSFAQVVNTNWQYNNTVCRAETICPNGNPIWCQTVALNYGNAPAHVNNLCRTRVVPGQFIHCQGYADQLDALGRVIFVPANLPVSCF